VTEIPEVVEGSNIVIPDYAGREFSEGQISSGSHRKFVSGGGSWEEDGRVQLTFLQRCGLQPGHKLVDIGCGALRAGRHLVDYLDSGNYYGVDANRQLIEIGYDRELTDQQRAKLPASNLRANDRFDTDFDVTFDMAIAQSLFTHVSLNHMRLCLYRLAKVMAPGGTFFASYFEMPADKPIDHHFRKSKSGRTYFYEKNVYWYHRSDLAWAAGDEWATRYTGTYGSSSTQVMMAYTRVQDEEVAAKKAEVDRRATRARQVRDTVRAGGAQGFILRARRKASNSLSPYS
jgi:SAM-dependent methyltransferase